MNLTDIRKERIRLQKKFPAGRGRSSGLGKTCGVGGKGQWGRAGTRFRPYFEGGQMPLIRRLPKRGFNNNAFKEFFELVSLGDLDRHFDAGAVVDAEALRAKGLVRRHRPVKVTASGKLTKKLTVKADRFTQAAAEAIAKARGTAEGKVTAPVPAPAPAAALKSGAPPKAQAGVKPSSAPSEGGATPGKPKEPKKKP